MSQATGGYYQPRQRPERVRKGIQPDTSIERTRQAKIGSKNHNWKGDKVSRGAVHDWIKTRLPKPEKCEHCQQKPPRDLANKSGEYRRDLSDWEWLCRRCHMISDGRMNNLKQYREAAHA
jgi:hypothetical protein